MCGRYYFAFEDSVPFQRLQYKVEQKALFEYAREEVFPSQKALVLTRGENDYDVDVMKWGMEGYQGKRLINARKEGIEQKKTFAPYLKKRCLIPCNGFYEWVKTGNGKQKIYIRKQDMPLFYLAGIYNEKKEFVIVTGEASDAMAQIHNRTPIIVREEQIISYLQEELAFQVDNEDLLFIKEKK